MRKTQKISSSSIERKKNIKPTINNNKKYLLSKSKPTLNKSIEKKKKVNLITEPNKSTTIEAKYQKDKIHLTKQRKDKSGNKKSFGNNSRSANAYKDKVYENTLYKFTEDTEREKEKQKEYDFFNFKFTSNESKKKYKNRPKPIITKFIEDDSLSKSSYSRIKREEEKNKESSYDKMNKKFNNNENDEDIDSDEKKKKKSDDMSYRSLYRTILGYKELITIDSSKIRVPQKDKNENNKEIEKPKEKSFSQGVEQFDINLENTDDIQYNNIDKKINLKDNKLNIYNQKINSSQIFGNLVNERTIDFFINDIDGEESVVSTKNKKSIDITRNKFKEIKIENYDKISPIRKEKLTGFILIRKNNGKRIYDIELEDDLDKINELLNNKKIMIKSEIIQFITLKQLTYYEREIKSLNDKIKRFQNDLNIKVNSNDKIKEETEKDNQISKLQSKIEELNKILNRKQDEIDENIREFKQVKLAYDLLKDSIEKQKSDQPKKEAISKFKKKAAQMQIDENNDQKSIKEMKLRIKNYKNELKNPHTYDEKHRVSLSIKKEDPLINKNQSPRKQREKMDSPLNKENLEVEPLIQPQEIVSKEEVDDISVDDDYDIGDEENDPKKKKMKNAMVRFRKKYHEVIREEKELQKQREREEKEREENEERELEDENYQINDEYLGEEIERKEREERERKEIEEEERKEREERERKEREEKERKEIEEEERKEREEREKKEREEREREEREKKERKEREEKERKEREEKSKKEKLKGGKSGNAKMMGGNFAKMLAEKLKNPPVGMKKGRNSNKRDSLSNPPILDKNIDMITLLEKQPFQKRKDKKKPPRKVFVDKED